ncbi:MAG: hypothetical protein R3Y13_01195 [bacterium]
MDKLIEELKELLEKPMKEIDIVIDEIYFYEKNKNGFLTVVVDKESGIDLDAIVEVSKIVSKILDGIDKDQDNYILDVISKERGKENE